MWRRFWGNSGFVLGMYRRLQKIGSIMPSVQCVKSSYPATDGRFGTKQRILRNTMQLSCWFPIFCPCMMFYATVCYLREPVILCYPIVIFLNDNRDRAWRACLLNTLVTMLYRRVKIPFLKEKQSCGFSCHVLVQVFKLGWNHYCTETGELLKLLNGLLRKQPRCRQWCTSPSCATLPPLMGDPLPFPAGAVVSECASLFSPVFVVRSNPAANKGASNSLLVF